MKADVQYNDFLGTSAADIADHKDLTSFLRERGVDTERYEPIGSSFFYSEDSFTAYIICIDNQQTQDKNQPYIVRIGFEKEISIEEYFGYFKRYEVVAVKDYYKNLEVKQEINIDDREEGI